jgi:Transglutaminase-like superfamily
MMRLLGHRVADYATLAETMSLALAIEVGLRLTSISSLLDQLDRLRPSANCIASRPSYGLERFVAAAYRLMPIGATCLRESLVLYGLLRRRGGAPRLCVGVKKDGNGLAAHAWIECAGLPRMDHSPFVELQNDPRGFRRLGT